MKGILIALIFLSACSSPPVHRSQASDRPKPVYPAKKYTDTVIKNPTNTPPYIDFYSVKINGVIPMISTKKSLYAALGNPDSITTPDRDTICTSFYNKPFKYIYIKGSVFELYGNTVVASTLNFKGSGLTIVSGNLTLNGNTTLASLNKIFPVAYKERSALLLEDNTMAISIKVATGKKENDDSWILLFEKGRV